MLYLPTQINHAAEHLPTNETVYYFLLLLSKALVKFLISKAPKISFFGYLNTLPSESAACESKTLHFGCHSGISSRSRSRKYGAFPYDEGFILNPFKFLQNTESLQLTFCFARNSGVQNGRQEWTTE